jgi:hypothetical protein
MSKTGGGSLMRAMELRRTLTRGLLKEINEAQYPSVTLMNRAEGALGTVDVFADYVEVLVEKVVATRFPSISLLNRLDSLLAQLENLERQQAETATSAERTNRAGTPHRRGRPGRDSVTRTRAYEQPVSLLPRARAGRIGGMVFSFLLSPVPRYDAFFEGGRPAPKPGGSAFSGLRR